MIDTAAVFREVLEFWNGPSEGELSLDAFLSAFNRRVREALLDLDLTPDAAFLAVRSSTFQFDSPDTREKSLSFLVDLSRPIRVESRGLDSSSEDDWMENTHASFENWNDTMERGDDNFIAFYGMPPDLRMIINRDASNEEFRVVYTSQPPSVTSTSDQVVLPDHFQPYLVYDISLEVGELIDNYSPEFLKRKADKMAYLLERVKETKTRLDRWRRSQKGTSPTTRRPFNDRNAGWLSPRRYRFTINL
jgi:hypothetical protein